MPRGLRTDARGQRPDARETEVREQAGGVLRPAEGSLNLRGDERPQLASRFSWRLAAGVWSLFCFLAPGAHAAMLPDQIGAFKKGESHLPAAVDAPLYSEYGLEDSEQAEYAASPKHFSVTAWRTRDSTGAMALFEARLPATAIASNLAKLAVRSPAGVLLAYGNYVFQFAGGAPEAADLAPLYENLPKLEQSPLPLLMSYLPGDGLVPNSQRYILGPASLERFEPKIPPAVAAFHLGSEAQLGKYKTSKGLLTVAIFSYPTPGLAKDQSAQFQQLPGAIVKRTGDLVAVTISPPDPDAAERILAKVNYQTNIMWNDKVPVNEQKGMARLLVNIFMFSGLLIFLCIVAGIGFGGFRIMARKLNRRGPEDAMIVLDLDHLGGGK